MSLSMLKGITVDGETSRDLDDGFFVQETKSGWNVSVFMAHPTSDSISPKIFQDALSTSNANAHAAPRPLDVAYET